MATVAASGSSGGLGGSAGSAGSGGVANGGVPGSSRGAIDFKAGGAPFSPSGSLRTTSSTPGMPIRAPSGGSLLGSAGPCDSLPAFVKGLRAMCRKQCGSRKSLVEGIRELMERYDGGEGSWRKFASFDGWACARNLLAFDEHFSLMLVCYKRGQTAPLHELPSGSKLWIRVLEGKLRLTGKLVASSDGDGDGGFDPETGSPVLRSRGCKAPCDKCEDCNTCIGDALLYQTNLSPASGVFVLGGQRGVAHSLGSYGAGDDLAVSLHVHSPPCFELVTMRKQKGDSAALPYSIIPVVYRPIDEDYSGECEEARLKFQMAQPLNLLHEYYLSFDELVTVLRQELVVEPAANRSPAIIRRVREMLERFRFHPKEWDQYSNFQRKCYTRNLVGYDEKFTLLVLCWDAGQASPIHDHATSSCWMKILSGKMKETRYSTAEDGTLRVIKETFLGTEGAAYIDNSRGLHKMENASQTEPSVSLHIYAPPYHRCTLFDPTTGAKRLVTIGCANNAKNPFYAASLTEDGKWGEFADVSGSSTGVPRGSSDGSSSGEGLVANTPTVPGSGCCIGEQAPAGCRCSDGTGRCDCGAAAVPADPPVAVGDAFKSTNDDTAGISFGEHLPVLSPEEMRKYELLGKLRAKLRPENVSDLVQMLRDNVTSVVSGGKPESVALAIHALLEAARFNDREWNEYVHFSEQRYQRILLAFNENFSMVLNCWNPGQGTPVHAHGDGRTAWVRVISGNLRLFRYGDGATATLSQPLPPILEDRVSSSLASSPSVGQSAGDPAQDDCASSVSSNSQTNRAEMWNCSGSSGLDPPVASSMFLSLLSGVHVESDWAGYHRLFNESSVEPAVSLHIYSPPYIDCGFVTPAGHRFALPVVNCSKLRCTKGSVEALQTRSLCQGMVFGNCHSFVDCLRRAFDTCEAKLRDSDLPGNLQVLSKCAVGKALSTFQIHPRELEVYARFAATVPTRRLVAQERRFSVLLCCLAPGQELILDHKHYAESWSAVKVVAGQLSVTMGRVASESTGGSLHTSSAEVTQGKQTSADDTGISTSSSTLTFSCSEDGVSVKSISRLNGNIASLTADSSAVECFASGHAVYALSNTSSSPALAVQVISPPLLDSNTLDFIGRAQIWRDDV